MKYFAYCRKSQDDEGRQILSIPAQRDEVQRLLLKHDGIELSGVFEEARTAKAPGRPVFNEMVARIERGEAQGIIAWHPDRLARNSIDGGQLIYQLDRGVLKDLKFATYTFENSSQGKFMLQIMFGYSKYYVDSLSENVKRGNRRKLEQGVLPNRPPIGYRNDPETNTIVPDPATFNTIRRIWDLMLSGNYSVAQVRDMSDHGWGFRTPKRKRSGGVPLTVSGIYHLLSHRFYTGEIPWRGKTYPGKHRPMVTLDEFERVHELIGRPGRPAPHTRTFAYTGLIRCGTCGCAVTAERQINRYGYEYEYYHCTKKKRGSKCPERYVSTAELERQIRDYLESCRISDDIHAWLMEESAKRAAQHASVDGAEIEALKSAAQETERNLKTLTDLAVRELIDEAEFVDRRDALRAEANQIRQRIDEREAKPVEWLEPFHTLISFSNLAVFWFEHANPEQKRLILTSVGSNLTLTDKKLNIQAVEPLDKVPKNRSILELCTVEHDVRTFLSDRNFKRRLVCMRLLIKKMKKRKKKLRPANDNEMHAAA
jgi:site-specific DNA recombinase